MALEAREQYTRLTTGLKSQPIDSDGDGSLEASSWGGKASVMQDTLVQPVFNLKVFAIQLFLNATEPVSGLLASAVYGCHKAKVMGLIPFRSCNMTSEFHHWDPAIAVLSTWLYFAYRPSFDEGSVYYQEVIMWPWIAMLVQKMMVAYKYAMLTAEEYTEFLDAPLEVAMVWNQNLQLISGWMPLPEDLLLSELRIASQHVGRDIAQRKFVYNITDAESLSAWHAMNAVLTNNDPPREGMTEELSYKLLQSSERCESLKAHILQHAKSMGERSACAQDVFVQLLRVARDGCIPIDAKHCFHFTLLLVLVYPLDRVYGLGWQEVRFTEPSTVQHWLGEAAKAALGGGNIPVAISCLISWRLIMKYNSIVLIFVSSAAAHYHRTKLLLMYLALLPRTVQDSHPNLPQLQLEFHAEQNLESLLLCFEIAVQYGTRYRARLDSFLVTVFVAACLILATLYLQIGAAIEAGGNLGFLRANALVLCGTTGIVFGMICATVFAGASANESFKVLSHNVVSRRWRQYYMSRRETYYKEKVEAENPSNSQSASASNGDKDGDAFDLAVERINCLASAAQVRVAGFEASTDLGWAFAGTVYPVILMILAKIFFPQYDVSIA